MNKLYVCLLLLTFGALPAQNLNPQVIQESPIACPGECVDYHVGYVTLRETTSYVVQSIPYEPIYPFTGGTQVAGMGDDTWSTSLEIGFPFCFYGQTYQSINIGSNGVVTFSAPEENFCPWYFTTAIPDTDFPILNAIYGVYQDLDITLPEQVTASINYLLAGEAPNRALIINFYDVPAQSCITFRQTSQIVLHETSNWIEVNVANRNACTGSTNSRALIGIQNATGDQAVSPDNRNTGIWNATGESWQFKPYGNSLTSFSWSFNGGPSVYSDEINVCPGESPGVLEARVEYETCWGENLVFSTTVGVPVYTSSFSAPEDIHICSTESQATFDLTSNDAVILAGLEPNYMIMYHLSLFDAQYGIDPIYDPQTFLGTDGQMIYPSVMGIDSPCTFVTDAFALNIDNPATAPIGETSQDFYEGQTLADLDVTGIAIQWYADIDLTQPLSTATLLEDGVTYYAVETYLPPGCQEPTGRRTFDPENVLAVTVHMVLSTEGFEAPKINVFPNPSKNIVKLESLEAFTMISLYSVSGQLLLQQPSQNEKETLDLSGLSKGIYLLRARTEKGTLVTRLIKE